MYNKKAQLVQQPLPYRIIPVSVR